MFSETDKVVLFGLGYLVSQKWCLGCWSRFYPENVKTIVLGTYSHKNQIFSICIFDVKLKASYCFILW